MYLLGFLLVITALVASLFPVSRRAVQATALLGIVLMWFAFLLVLTSNTEIFPEHGVW